MTELFDFVWPAVTALVFARSKAYRYRKLSGEERRLELIRVFQSVRSLRKEYQTISGIKRASLGSAYIDVSWPEQEQVFARLVLVNIFAIHEGWLDDLAAELVQRPILGNAWAKKFVTAAQFPCRNRNHEDWNWIVNELHAKRSPDLEKCFGTRLRGSQLYSAGSVIPMLYCYRYFKELRNAVMHGNGRVRQQLLNCERDYQPFANTIPQVSGATSPGTTNKLMIGDNIEMSLFGVVGFNDITLRLMATLHIEAALTTYGEEVLARFFISRTNTRSVSGDKQTTLRRMANEYGLPGLTATAEFSRMLIRHGVTIP